LSLRREEAIELGIYRALFRRIGEPWLWFSRLVMSDAGLAGVLHDPAFEVYVLRREDEDIGLLELDFRVPGECEISFFGVVETAIGTGAARFMMNRALARAWSAPIERMWLHTCTLDHPAALPFYQRSGFRPFKLQIEICDDPRLGGLLAHDAGPRIALLPGTTM
jgi:GNAT superfamily N-acetyltransferase